MGFIRNAMRKIFGGGSSYNPPPVPAVRAEDLTIRQTAGSDDLGSSTLKRKRVGSGKAVLKIGNTGINTGNGKGGLNV